MSLQQQLEEQKQATVAKAPAEVLTLMGEATTQLKQSGIENGAHKAGDKMPDFNLPNAKGKTVSLATALEKGPLVISIYRGGWCPYCNLELKALTAVLPDIRAAGAELIAIAPQLPEKGADSVTAHQLEFDVLSDVGNRVSRQLGLVFTLAEALRPIYVQFGIDIPAYNGDETFELPIPATYVVQQDGTISHAFISADHTERMEPTDILAALQ